MTCPFCKKTISNLRDSEIIVCPFCLFKFVNPDWERKQKNNLAKIMSQMIDPADPAGALNYWDK